MRWHVLCSSAVAALCLWGIWESGYGLLQVLGWRSSRHALFALTGHFNNPGPFGRFIACVMAVAVGWLMRFRVKPGMTERGAGRTAGMYTFRQDWYFFVGDNQLDNKDSRYFGFVPANFVFGIVPGF